VSLLLLFVGYGTSHPPAIDTHDGVWDEKAWRKYQKRLSKRRHELASLEQKDVERKQQLRIALRRLYKGIEEPRQEIQAAVVAREPEIDDAKYLKIVEEIENKLTTIKARAAAEEYRAILQREKERFDAEEEEELEILMMAVL